MPLVVDYCFDNYSKYYSIRKMSDGEYWVLLLNDKIISFSTFTEAECYVDSVYKVVKRVVVES